MNGAREGQVTLITGGVRGLGLACAREFARRGDTVHVTWRGSSELARELESEFPGRVHRADASDVRAWKELVGRLDRGIDNWVHAVGEYVHGELANTSSDDLRRMFQSNVETAALGLSALRSTLRARRGSAVLFGCAGLDGHRARRTTAAYTAAKSALLVLARSAALEEAPHGVRINVVSPGAVPHEHAASDTRDPALAARIPLGRAGTPLDVARAVAWLCSPDASYVTGANLEVAGGWLA